ncbi:MAG: hypothetical protein ACR2MU_00680 [Gaiellaceae bacterium]
MAKTKDKVLDASGNVKPYVERALKDDELRENVKNAFDSARDVYNELLGGRSTVATATRVANDKDIQDNLKQIVAELPNASDRLQGKKDHGGRNSSLLIAGIALGILFNPATGPATRKFISDKLFGGGDDFTYSSPGSSNGS